MQKRRVKDGVEELTQAMAGLPPEVTPSVVLHLGLDPVRTAPDGQELPSEEALSALAYERLLQGVREHEAVLRLPRGEFIILLHSVTSVLRAGRAADRLHRLIEQPFPLHDGTMAHVSACMGVALYPEDGPDAPSLLHCASIALRHAKAAGTGLIQFFEPAMESSRTMRRAPSFLAPSYLSTL